MKLVDTKKYVLGILLLSFAIIGTYFVKNSSSVPALTWMRVFLPNDFSKITLSEFLHFFQELQIPIPPIIGMAEIISIRFFGSPILVTRYLYRIGLVVAYCVAIFLASSSTKRMISSFFLSLLFLHATTKIHPGNPQNYDIFFSLFFLIFIVFLKLSINKRIHDRWKKWLFPSLAGFFLSMTELTRPFVVFVLPLLIVSSFLYFNKNMQKKQFVAFLIPIILLSGLWHTHLFMAHKLISFSNHSGFNLRRAWHIPSVNLVSEKNSSPLDEEHWANLNTDEHSENSRRLQNAVLKYWFSHPLKSFEHIIARMNSLLSAETKIYKHNPTSKWFSSYKLFVRIVSSFILINVGILIIWLLRNFSFYNISIILSDLDNIILIFTVFSIVLLSVGEQGEEARFLISLLPFFTTLPLFRFPTDNTENLVVFEW